MRTALLALAIALGSGPADAAPVATDITAQGPLGLLRGTMLMPEGSGRKPVALILPGSGPTDRDGNSPLGIRADTYRLLAEALAAQGIASVRIDKRGIGASRDAVADANNATVGTYAADTGNWIGEVRQRTGASCIWLIGHSEGGLVALEVARRAPDVCGLVLIATPGRPVGELMAAQLRADPASAPFLTDALNAIDTLSAGGIYDITGKPPAVAALFAPQIQPYLIDLFRRDPAHIISHYRGPVLIVQGESDLQVTADDAYALKDADAQAVLRLFPGVNHVLKTVVGDDRAANLATYSDPGLPLAPGVAKTIADFILLEGVEQ